MNYRQKKKIIKNHFRINLNEFPMSNKSLVYLLWSNKNKFFYINYDKK